MTIKSISKYISIVTLATISFNIYAAAPELSLKDREKLTNQDKEIYEKIFISSNGIYKLQDTLPLVLVSDPKKSKLLNDNLQNYVVQITSAINKMISNAHKNEELVKAIGSYQTKQAIFHNILLLASADKNDNTPSIKTIEMIQGKLSKLEPINDIQEMKFGIFAIYKKQKNSARVLLNNLNKLLNYEVDIVKRNVSMFLEEEEIMTSISREDEEQARQNREEEARIAEQKAAEIAKEDSDFKTELSAYQRATSERRSLDKNDTLNKIIQKYNPEKSRDEEQKARYEKYFQQIFSVDDERFKRELPYYAKSFYPDPDAEEENKKNRADIEKLWALPELEGLDRRGELYKKIDARYEKYTKELQEIAKLVEKEIDSYEIELSTKNLQEPKTFVDYLTAERDKFSELPPNERKNFEMKIAVLKSRLQRIEQSQE